MRTQLLSSLLLFGCCHAQLACGDCDGNGMAFNTLDGIAAYQVMAGLSPGLPSCSVDGEPGIDLCDLMIYNAVLGGFQPGCPSPPPNPCTSGGSVTFGTPITPPAPVGTMLTLRIPITAGTLGGARGVVTYDPTKLMPQGGASGTSWMHGTTPGQRGFFATTVSGLADIGLSFEVLDAAGSSVTIDFQRLIDGNCCDLPLSSLQVDANGVCGDCDQDGVVPTILDALVAARIATGAMTPTPPQVSSCDVNSDLSITVTDALLLAQAAAGLVVPLVCP